MNKGCLAGVVLSTGFMIGCVDSFNREQALKLAEENGVVIYFNGLLCNNAKKAAEELSREFGVVCVSDRRDILDILAAGENSMYGNNIFLHSAGSYGASSFARWCRINKIELRTVYSFDAFTCCDFGDAEVVNYRSSEPYIFGKQVSQGRVVWKERVNSRHLNLPQNASNLIKERMRAYRKIPVASGR